MPEPATVTLIGSGFVAFVVRYARRKYRQMKPWFDRIAGLMLLILFGPVILLCAALVKLTSRGPAFYVQERVGLDGQTFNLVKLRTMHYDAEATTGPVWAAPNDTRVTIIGRMLRRTHFDELPQLVNVLRGEMSLVGPRPERPYFVRRLKAVIPGYERRLAVKPGITGLAQVHGRYDQKLADVRRKVKLDLIYAQRMCWWVDFVILWKTVGKFFRLA